MSTTDLAIDFHDLLGNVEPSVRKRGKEYFYVGRVKNFQYNEYGAGVFLNATVLGTRKYNVSVSIDSSGNIDNYSCNCQAFYQYDGLCKHCAALLYAVIDKNAGEAKNINANKANPNAVLPTVTSRTDPGARMLLTELMKDETTVTDVEPGSVRIEPVLDFISNRIVLRLNIGVGRKYVVKNIYELIVNLDNGRFVQYGKGLAFKHIPEALSADSLALIKFLESRYDNKYLSPYDYYSKNDSILLTPGAFDDFFDLYRGQEVFFNGKDMVEFLVDDLKAPEISVKYLPDGAVVIKAKNNNMYLLSKEHIYQFNDNSLGRYTQLPKSADRLIRTLAANKSLTFARDDAAEFCGSWLPQIREHTQLSGDIKALESYLPESMTAELYLDTPDSDCIVCEPYCRYGEDLFVPVYDSGKDKPAHRRDMRSERRLYADLQAFFSKSENGPFEIRGNDAIYDFLTEHIVRLKNFGEVKISDRLKRLTVTAPRRFKVGVSLSGGMLKMELDSGEVPISRLAEILSAYREKRKYYRLPDGGFVNLGDSLEEIDELCDRLALSDKQISSGKAELPAYRAAQFDSLFGADTTLDINGDAGFLDFTERLRASYDSVYELPPSLREVLRPYQADGYRWLRRLDACSLGGILADEMGLGKTLQVIALLLSQNESGERLASIIVCPASLVYNWKRELEKFAPSLSVRVVNGIASQRRDLISGISDGDIVVTSYDLLKNDIEKYDGREFGRCIIDEAQYVKNHTTLAAKAVRQINSKRRFALTGTPIENRLSELWSIFDFLMPGYLYGYTRFRKRFEQPIVGGDTDADKDLRRMISPFVLRRIKSDVLSELPPKLISVFPVELGSKQREIYRASLALGLEQLKAGNSSEGESKIKALALLTRLRQICCDPALCFENYNGGSAKVEACMELLLQSKEAGHRVLLFSQFTTMLELLEPALTRENISYNVIRGSTRKEKRVEIADSFNGGEYDVLLVSLKAGGTGLNLTGADTVIHFDPWWNLAAESQATDRTHRIGQTKTVQVYKLIATGTVEEKVVELQERKRELSSLIDGNPMAGISADELLSVLIERE